MANHPNRGLRTRFSSPRAHEVKQAREDAYLTVEQAAARLFASPAAWMRWESGERPMHPAFWQLWKIRAMYPRILDDLA